MNNLKMLPSHMRDAVWAYIENGYLPGEFLQAIIKNDLKEAVGRADYININALPAYVEFFFNYAPGECWGSPEKVAAWVEKHKQERLSRETKKS